jgi:hypothetical protein
MRHAATAGIWHGRAEALAALRELACGAFAERMRREAAGRVLVTARRVAELAAEGALAPQPRAESRVEQAAQRWRRTSLPLAAFVATLAPAELAALLAEAPEWAEAVCASAQAS